MTISYDVWKVEVDAELVRLSGMDSDQLPDADYRLAYEEENRPTWAAQMILEEIKEMY